MKKILLSTLICLSSLVVGCATPSNDHNNSSEVDISNVSTTSEFDPVSYTQAYLSNFKCIPLKPHYIYSYGVPSDTVRFDFASIGDVSRLSFFKDERLQDEIYSKVITLRDSGNEVYMYGADGNTYYLSISKVVA